MLTDALAQAEGCYMDEAHAERVRTFLSTYVRHSKGQWAGKPFHLLDWQWEDIIRPLFGWRRADGTRRFRRGFISMAKKNGKSALFSGLSLYFLMADREPGAEIYSAASDRDQAGIVFGEAVNMAEQSPFIAKRVNLLKSTKRIVYPGQRSVYRALSSDVPNKEGLNAHVILFDELHAQPTRDLWDALRYAGAARREPMHLSITTAGYDKHSICYEQYQYARGCLDGTVNDPYFFAYICEADADADWHDEATWKQANPGWGVTIDPGQFREDYQEATESPRKENAFRRYRLNQWTEQDVRWINMGTWDDCRGRIPDLDGRKCWAGLDLSSTTDLSALVLIFPESEGKFFVLPHFWVPAEGAANREHRDKVPYTQWIREGFINATPGAVIDYDRIRADINALGKRYRIMEIAIDRWNATQLATQLDGDGFEMGAFGQGYASMTSPTKKLEELLVSGKLIHDGNPVLKWMAGNVSLETDAADNWKPSKKKSTERIDGIVALIMAIARATTGEDKTSIYETRGAVFI